MNDSVPLSITSVVALVIAVILLSAWVIIRYRRRAERSLASVLKDIAYERIQGLIIPKADEGEIQIDNLVLTAQGLLIVEVKDVEGAVFGSDKMQDWTVIGDSNRFTFTNPQPALYDRIAAVRQIVRQVPVAGRIVFLDGASFTKGIPSLVCNLDELLAEFGEQDKPAAAAKIEAFRPHWENIRARAGQAAV